ncbi:MAG TPA: PhoH family protein, partial [Myxococcales bacterium]|nr:PhoH family protein [Myxococcales bacterium]
MIKNFVLDTNVLLHDAAAMYTFGENNVVIPIYVIEELDNFKKDLNELGRNARQVSRTLDGLRGEGSLTEGVPMSDGGTLRVAFTEKSLPKKYSNTHQMDNSILATALTIQESEPDNPCVFISMDTNLRIRAEAVGLCSEDYDKDHIDISELYTGWLEVSVEDRFITLLNEEGRAPLNDMINQDELAAPLYENQYLLVRAIGDRSNAALCRLAVADNQVICLPRMREGVWGIRARNKEQNFVLDALLNDDIRLVTLVGKAGTGKTLLAIAGGLARTTDAEIYHRLLVSRPIFPLGKDIGYLPGSIEEKLNPWMQPIYDNVELLLGLSRQDKSNGRSYHELVDMGIIQIEPLTYIRGRSIPHQYLIVDEAQNLTPHEVKTIITRAGEGTKV